VIGLYFLRGTRRTANRIILRKKGKKPEHTGEAQKTLGVAEIQLYSGGPRTPAQKMISQKRAKKKKL